MRATLRFCSLFAAAVVSVMVPAVARAHTDLEYTLPTDGAAVGEPVDEITVGFTEPVTLVGPGFEVLDASGTLVTPFVVTDDDTIFRLQIDPPLVGGDIGVRYEVAAADGHVLTGSFSFTVTAVALPTTVAATTTTAAPSTTTAAPSTTTPAPSTTVTAPPTTALPVVSAAVTAPAATEAPSESGGNGLYILIAAGVAIGAAAFLLFRPKPDPTP